MALAAWAGFAIGRYVVDDPQTAVFASLSTEELGRGALECAASARGAGEARLDATVRLFGARAWIAELGGVIDRLGATAATLAR